MKSLACFALISLSSCAIAQPSSKHPAPTVDKPVMTGPLSRAVVATIPGWKSEVQIDVDAAAKLAKVAPGATVTVILGTWCSDSKREVSRLWQALDAAGPVPFTVELIGVDRDKHADGLSLEVSFVPLIIVRRDGEEVGRIVESAPRGIEVELLALLDGTATGTISGKASPVAP